MSQDRFFVPGFPDDDDERVELVLDGDEARHLLRVKRHRVGDDVEVFDGRGRVATATVVATTKSTATLDLAGRERRPRMPACELRLAVALPRSGGADDLLRRAVELGVTEVIPLRTERSTQKPDRKDPAAARERFRRLAIAAMKQCGRNEFPTLADASSLGEVAGGCDEVGIYGVAEGQGEEPRAFERRCEGVPARVLVVVGPEGGLSPAEEEFLSSRGFHAITSGPTVLRVETAVTVLLGWLASARTVVSRGPAEPGA
ncbi:MAG: 16S rRNA (uracil(1498)-N(3))-methyltransferase [Planctomycetes bacterium]|nr:16S rRNA (uracil(1498)-N(3))-methyltransferase [Planctomycetota bacterium]